MRLALFGRNVSHSVDNASDRLRTSSVELSDFMTILRGIFYKNISRTSAVSSTNFGSILIFASCVVGTCNILCG